MDINKLEKIFKEKLSKAKFKETFGFACFFGSSNIKNDLDFFIVPKKEIKKGKFMKNLILFLEEIKKQLGKEKIGLLIVYHSTYEEEVEFINSQKTKDQIVIHISSFPDIHPISIPDYLPYLKKTEKVLLGKYSAIQEMKKTKLDYYYNYLFISNCLLSNYPKELEKEKIINKTNYIYKFVPGNKKKLSGDPRQIFFDCCDFLDGSNLK